MWWFWGSVGTPLARGIDPVGLSLPIINSPALLRLRRSINIELHHHDSDLIVLPDRRH